MKLNPFRPYDQEWFESEVCSDWVVKNSDEIERCYTNLWQQLCSTFGQENTTRSMNIYIFAQWLDSQMGKESPPSFAATS
jgi:hypothetical protein